MFAVKSLVQANVPNRTLALRHFASKKVDSMHELFNAQVTNEFAASRNYLSAHIWFTEKELTGMASFALKESQEEHKHALTFVNFGLKRDIPIDLEPLPAPHARWESPEAVWSDLLEAEKSNSKALYELANAAHAAQDHAVTTFLMPFHSEQVDAEDNLKTILAKVREETRTPGLIRQLDSEMGGSGGSE